MVKVLYGVEFKGDESKVCPSMLQLMFLTMLDIHRTLTYPSMANRSIVWANRAMSGDEWRCMLGLIFYTRWGVEIGRFGYYDEQCLKRIMISRVPRYADICLSCLKIKSRIVVAKLVTASGENLLAHKTTLPRYIWKP